MRHPLLLAGSAFLLALAAVLAASDAQQTTPHAQDNPGEEHLPGLLLKKQLTPPPRSGRQLVRFSPDGSYILVQDEAGIYVLTREPLESRFWIAVPEAMPAQFSSDSRTLIVASPDLMIRKWSLAEHRLLEEKKINREHGCFGASLSPDGEVFACFGPGSVLTLYRGATGERIFSSHLFGSRPDLVALTPFVISIPRGNEGPFAEPFGYFWANSDTLLVGHVDASSRMHFSSDGRYFLLDTTKDRAILVDVAGRKEVGISGSLRRHLAGHVEFVTAEKLAVLDPEKAENSVVITVPGGNIVERLPVTASEFSSTSDPRYLAFVPPGRDGVRVLDLEDKRVLEIPPQDALDIHAGELAGVSDEGEVCLFHIGENQPRAKITLPLDPLFRLRVAVVSPDLGTLVLSMKGQGGVWDISTGERIERFSRLSGAWCEDKLSCYIRLPKWFGQPGRIEKFDIAGRSSSDAWLLDKETGHELNYSSGPVVLEYVLASTPIFWDLKSSSLPFELRARDVKTGRQQWSRKFERDAPVPYSDPQGDRVVLSWKAASDSAHDAAKQDPSAYQRLKEAKPKARDFFFEVLDARSGKMLGGVIVPIETGPSYFDSAFSAGDWLILVRDNNWVSIHSLSTGREEGRVFGHLPAVSAESRLLCASEGRSLTVYDLATLNKRATYNFRTPVVYSHFAADGKRLFVLTWSPTGYTLDVSAGVHAELPGGTGSR